MSKFLFALLFVTFTWTLHAEEDNHYELLNSLDPAVSSRAQEGDFRVPASAQGDQIQVRKSLPEARPQKTARTLQWEVLKKAPKNSDIEAEGED